MKTWTNSEIQIRDPFVLPVASEGAYYLFGTTDKDCWHPPAQGFDCYVGTDLESWRGPLPAFRPPQAFWSDRHYWAPEVHAWQGRHYLFASFKAEGVARGTQIFGADRPAGPYLAVNDGPVTPATWECLDGTLHVDDAGEPWIVFCHEWLQVGDGRVCAAPLSRDLRRAVSDPVTLFAASAAPWTRPFNDRGDRVTDGPFLFRSSAGALLMLWSSMGRAGYAIGVARSLTGGILGPWEQEAEPLFGEDGGHGMVFRTFDGRLMLTLHAPNITPNERPRFYAIEETAGGRGLRVCPPVRRKP